MHIRLSCVLRLCPSAKCEPYAQLHTSMCAGNACRWVCDVRAACCRHRMPLPLPQVSTTPGIATPGMFDARHVPMWHVPSLHALHVAFNVQLDIK